VTQVKKRAGDEAQQLRSANAETAESAEPINAEPQRNAEARRAVVRRAIGAPGYARRQAGVKIGKTSTT
jgi:hypothetical protein